jgi:serine/threonine-protein kinase
MDVSREQGMVPTMSVAALPTRKSSSEVAYELLKQETLGEYEILGELGRGGMATVFLAHHIALDRKVAIKVMAPALLDEGLAERFRREARTAAALNHPHIIPIYGVYERNALLYFVMKFVAGQSLDPILHTHGHLPVPVARTVLAQAASALGYAHRRGVVHRDVKPANIMLDDEGWVIMTDFGIAKVPTATGLTLTGVTVGTPAYMSPEQCLGKEVTGASDQYSLGILAYELLTGQKPFTAVTAMAMMYAHFNEEPKPLRELRPDIPEELEASILRMLAKNPEDRWPKIDDAFGSPVLAHDDPVRQQLVSMAQASPNAIMAAQLTSPTSPIPPARRTSVRVVTPSTTAPVLPASSREPAAVSPPAEPPRTESMQAPGPTEALPTAPPQPPVAEVAPPAVPVASPPAAIEPAAAAPAPPPAVAPPVAAPARVTDSAVPPPRPSVSAATRKTVPVRPPRSLRPRLAPLWAGVGLAALVTAALLLRSATNSESPAPPVEGRSRDSLLPGGVVSGRDSLAGSPTTPTGGRAVDSQPASRPSSPQPPAPVAVARVELQPPRATLEVGKSLRLGTRLLAASGAALGSDGRAVAWTSSAPAVAEVSEGGLVTAIGAGRATITASVEGITSSTAITVPPPALPPVAPAAVASISIQPESATMVVGRQAALRALLRDSRGAPLADRPVGWSVTPESVAAIAQGNLIARAPGVARIVARVDGVSGFASVTVIHEPVAGVRLPPPPGALQPGQTLQLVATALAASGAALEGRPATWTSDNPQVATVQNGLVTARAPGSTEIAATIDGQRRAVEVSVTAPAAPAPAGPALANPVEDQRRVTVEATRLLETFVAALNSRDMDRVKAAYPGMTADEEGKWRRTLENRNVSKVRATLQQGGQLRLEGDGAEMPALIRLVVTVSGIEQPNEQNYRAAFSREGGTWRLMRLDARSR